MWKKGVDRMLVDFQAAEEEFVEKHFEYGNNDEEILQKNFLSALKVYEKANYICNNYAEQICNGEVVDSSSASLELLNLIFAYKYAYEFRKALEGRKGL